MIVWRLKQVAQGRGFKQSELIEKTKIRVETMSGYYTGKAISVKIQHLNALCEILDCTIPDIIEYKPD